MKKNSFLLGLLIFSVIFGITTIYADSVKSNQDKIPKLSQPAFKKPTKGEKKPIPRLTDEQIEMIAKIGGDQPFYELNYQGTAREVEIQSYFEEDEGLTVKIEFKLITKKSFFSSRGISYRLKLEDGPEIDGRVDIVSLDIKDKRQDSGSFKSSISLNSFPEPAFREFQKFYCLAGSYITNQKKVPSGWELSEEFDLRKLEKLSVFPFPQKQP